MKKLLTERTIVTAARQGASLQEAVKGGARGYIVEAQADGRLLVKLPVTVLDERNENDRVYSEAVMKHMCETHSKSFESRELLSTVNEHPESPYPVPGEASHIVTRAWCEGKHLWNEWDVLDTQNGRNLRALVEAGASFGVSIRGLGSLDYQGNIQEDYEYLGTDCVGQPSARIRTAPIIVSESTQPAPRTSLKTESARATQAQSHMNTLDQAKTYVREQIVLMGSEPVEQAIRRVITVEDALAASGVSSKELVECYTSLEAAKANILKPKAALVEGKDGKPAPVAQTVKTMRESMRQTVVQITEKFRATTDKLQATVAETSTVNGHQKKALKVFRGQLERTKVESKAIKTEVARLKAALAASQFEAKAEKARADEAVQLAARNVVRTALARRVAVENATKYKLAIQEAGVAIKAAKVAKPAALQTESRPMVDPVDPGLATPRARPGVVAFVEKSTAAKNATKGDSSARHPGWI